MLHQQPALITLLTEFAVKAASRNKLPPNGIGEMVIRTFCCRTKFLDKIKMRKDWRCFQLQILLFGIYVGSHRQALLVLRAKNLSCYAIIPNFG